MTKLFGAFLVASVFVNWQSNNAYGFGYEGRQGRDGEAGYSGRDGQNSTVFANGQAYSLDLKGEDAYQGYDGERGEDANSCYQPQPNYNIEGARGGRGGDAGNGGSGGNGGNLFAYYQDVNQLKQIYVDSTPGRGGRAGYPGTGGRPCYCQYRSWSTKSCHTEKDKNGKETQVCTTNTYYCRDGYEGPRGEYGVDGFNGSMGTLYAVKSNTPLPNSVTSMSLSFGEINNGPFVLTKNMWDTRNGANQLLGFGSRINNTYYEWAGLQTWSVGLKWNNRRDPSLFSSGKIGIYLSGDNVQVDTSSDIWANTTETGSPFAPLFSFDKIIFATEAGKLIVNGLSGMNTDLVATLTDTAQVSDMVNTSFEVKYESDGALNHTRYEGPVSANLIELKNHQYLIHLGQLPIKAKYLKEGEDILVTFDVTQTLGGKYATQEIKKFKYKIGM